MSKSRRVRKMMKSKGPVEDALGASPPDEGSADMGSDAATPGAPPTPEKPTDVKARDKGFLAQVSAKLSGLTKVDPEQMAQINLPAYPGDPLGKIPSNFFGFVFLMGLCALVSRFLYWTQGQKVTPQIQQMSAKAMMLFQQMNATVARAGGAPPPTLGNRAPGAVPPAGAGPGPAAGLGTPA